jgi:hypothetical protein
MRTRLQALLSSTALAAAIAGAALMSSGSSHFANADVVTDTVRDMMTSLMNSQGAALPEATRTAVGAALNGTSDGAAMMTQLSSLAAQNAALAETIGSALGKASLSLQLSNPSAANEVHAFVSSTTNPNMMTGYNSAQRPVTAQVPLRSSSVLVAADGDGNNTDGLTQDQLLLLNNINPAAGGAPIVSFVNSFTANGFNAAFFSANRQLTSQIAYIANTFRIGPYSAY